MQEVQMVDGKWSQQERALLTSPQSCSCSCCRCWTLCWAGGSCSWSAPLPCRSLCSSGWVHPSPSYFSPLNERKGPGNIIVIQLVVFLTCMCRFYFYLFLLYSFTFKSFVSCSVRCVYICIFYVLFFHVLSSARF